MNKGARAAQKTLAGNSSGSSSSQRNIKAQRRYKGEGMVKEKCDVYCCD